MALREGQKRISSMPEMIVTEPVIKFPLPIEENTENMTPADRLFVLAHLGIPNVGIDSWTCQITGMVGSPRELRYNDILQFPRKTVRSFFQCAGNPLQPTTPARQVANTEWSGALLRDVLAQAEVNPRSRFLWSFGIDHGSFFGSPRQEHYVKDLPMDYVMSRDVLVATHLNGEPLSLEHGFPARIVAPGFYGTNSVKWLCRLEVADRRADAYFTRELYNDPTPDGGSTPVWDVAPESLIVRPTPDSTVSAASVEISGWAWSSEEIASVEVSTDGGVNWNAAQVLPREANSRQRFTFHCSRLGASHLEILSRATDVAGRRQPLDGARNAVHRVNVLVKDGDA